MLDGNGRWATKRGLPRSAGHYAGMNTMRRIIKYSNELAIEHLTLYAFSSENWKRLQKEVGELRPDHVEVKEAKFFDMNALPEKTNPLIKQHVMKYMSVLIQTM